MQKEISIYQIMASLRFLLIPFLGLTLLSNTQAQGPQGMPDFSGEWDLVRPSSGAVVGQYTITLIPEGIFITAKSDGEFLSATQKTWEGAFKWNASSIMFENTQLGFRIMTGSGNYDSMGLDVNGGMNFEYQYLKRANLQTPQNPTGAGVQTTAAAAAASPQDLSKAVKMGDLTAVESILKTDASGLKTLSPQGTTPLHEAVVRGDVMMVETLLNAGADPNMSATNGKSSIDVAIEKGNEDVAEAIINRSMNVKITDQSLDRVVKTKNSKMLNLLLSHGVDPNKAIRLIEKTNDVEMFYEVSSNYAVTVDNTMFESAVAGRRPMMAQAILEKGIDNDRALSYCIARKDKNLMSMALAFGARPEPALQYAVDNNDTQFAQSVIGDYGADPNGPMKSAVESKNSQMTALLVQSGADPNAQMNLASASGSDDIVRVLLNGGADANQGIDAAANAGKWSTVKILVAEGMADANRAMKQAVDNGNYDATEFLLTYGAGVSNPELISSACAQEKGRLVALLLQNGADPNAGMSSAVGKGNVSITTQLLDAGASPASAFLLETAVNQKNKAMAQLLVSRGADPNNGIRSACTVGSDAILVYLLSQGADGSQPGLLRSAVHHNNTTLVQHLIEAGANPAEGIERAVQSNAGKVVAQLGQAGVPLDRIEYMTTAVNNGFIGVARSLVEGGCDPTTYKSSDGGNYLHIAANREDYQMVDLLLKAGVDVNKPRSLDGETPLHIAVEGKNDNLDMVVLLISRGADMNAVNHRGKSVLQEAKGGRVKSYLKDNGAERKPNR
jgi:ankyrin repeat protein